MEQFFGLILLIVFVGGVLLFLSLQAKTGFATTGMKMRRAIPASWDLYEFLKLKPSRWKLGEYYLFREETIRSLGHRYVGRFDGAILHWEEAPILDIVIEYKFPVNYLPDQSLPEDVFQAGLYALALMESGVSCSNSRLVTIYCLQDRAKRCTDKRSPKSCWSCGESKIHTDRFKPKQVIRALKKLDEVWYNGRRPKPTPGPNNCRPCPYSRDKCNYSAA